MTIIRNLKQTPSVVIASKNDVSIRVLSVNSNEGIFNQDVENITAWRNLFSDAYLTCFLSTKMRSYNWLVNSYMLCDSDLMLMFDDEFGVCFGHIAFINFETKNGHSSCELSRVVRAPGLGGPQGMKLAFLLAMKWCADMLDVDTIKLEVFADNNSAIKFYKYFGFVEYEQRNVHKVFSGSDYKWELCDEYNQERKLLLMKRVVSKSISNLIGFSL